MVKIVGVCGSPKKGGNTELMVKTALEAAQAEGVETKLITLADKKINFCLGHDKETCIRNDCLQKDDMISLYDDVENADGLIIGTPTYWGLPSAQIIAFLQRLGHLGRKGTLKGKVVGAISTGGVHAGGEESNILDIFRWAHVCDMYTVSPPIGGYSHFGGVSIGNAKENTEGLNSAKLLGKKIVETIKKLKGV